MNPALDPYDSLIARLDALKVKKVEDPSAEFDLALDKLKQRDLFVRVLCLKTRYFQWSSRYKRLCDEVDQFISSSGPVDGTRLQEFKAELARVRRELYKQTDTYFWLKDKLMRDEVYLRCVELAQDGQKRLQDVTREVD